MAAAVARDDAQNATWLMIVTAAALRWIIRGPIGSRVLGNVE